MWCWVRKAIIWFVSLALFVILALFCHTCQLDRFPHLELNFQRWQSCRGKSDPAVCVRLLSHMFHHSWKHLCLNNFQTTCHMWLWVLTCGTPHDSLQLRALFRVCYIKVQQVKVQQVSLYCLNIIFMPYWFTESKQSTLWQQFRGWADYVQGFGSSVPVRSWYLLYHSDGEKRGEDGHSVSYSDHCDGVSTYGESDKLTFWA